MNFSDCPQTYQINSNFRLNCPLSIVIILKYLINKGLRRVILSVIVAIACGSILLLSQLNFDYNFEHFFPKGDPDIIQYQLSKKAFHADSSDYLSIALGDQNGVFSNDFLKRVKKLNTNLKSLDEVITVSSILSEKRALPGPFGRPFFSPYVHINNPEKLRNDSILIMRDPTLLRTLVGVDGKSIAIHLKLKNDLNQVESEKLWVAIKAEVDKYNFSPVHYAGRLQGQQAFIKVMRTDAMWFILISLTTIICSLYVIFRSPLSVIIPIIVIALSCVITLGIMVLLDKPLNLMTSLIPTILFVVGTSDVIHFLEAYFTNLSKVKHVPVALKKTISEIGWATMITSLTTGIGFLCLLTSVVLPILEFGLFSAIGVLLAYIITFSILPAILLSMKTSALQNSKNGITNFFENILSVLFLGVFKRKIIVLIFTALLLVLGVFGTSKLNLTMYMMGDWPDSHPHRQGYAFFEDNYGGFRPFELLIKAKGEHDLFEPNILKQLAILDTFLTNTYKIRNLSSPFHSLKGANMALNGYMPSYYRLPETTEMTGKLYDQIKHLPALKMQLAESGKLCKWRGLLPDIGSTNAKNKNILLQQLIKSNIDSQYLDIQITGIAHIIDKNADYIVSNTISGLLMAMGITSIIFGLFLRNLKYSLLALLPNIFPLILIAGFMGWMEIELNIQTSIVFMIGFGIAVDDTIHFLARYNHERKSTEMVVVALWKTYKGTGKAIILTSLVLLGGFSSLLSATLTSIFEMGLLLCLVLLFALIADLLLLPVLLFFVDGKKD